MPLAASRNPIIGQKFTAAQFRKGSRAAVKASAMQWAALASLCPWSQDGVEVGSKRVLQVSDSSEVSNGGVAVCGRVHGPFKWASF